jgi:hypothetical protein
VAHGRVAEGVEKKRLRNELLSIRFIEIADSVVTPSVSSMGQSEHPPGFPLKACGNDGLLSTQQISRSKLQGNETPDLTRKSSRQKFCELLDFRGEHSFTLKAEEPKCRLYC